MSFRINLAILFILFPFALQAEEWDYAQLLSFVKEQQPRRISEVVNHRLLPDSYKERFTLAHSSLSLHGSSPQYPRVISFGDTAQLILTHNGNPEQRAYYGLETAEYNDQEKRIYFREAVFIEDWLEYLKHKQKKLLVKETKKYEKDSASQDSLKRALSWLQANNQKVEARPSDDFFSIFNLKSSDIEPFEDGSLVKNGVFFTKPNPLKCMQCHAVNKNELTQLNPDHKKRVAKYIWSPYSNWPGMYGSFDDELYNYIDLPGEVYTELESLARLKYRVSKEPGSRYSYLNWSSDLLAPYSYMPRGDKYEFGKNSDRIKLVLDVLEADILKFLKTFPVLAPTNYDEYRSYLSRRPNLLLTKLLAIKTTKVQSSFIELPRELKRDLVEKVCSDQYLLRTKGLVSDYGFGSSATFYDLRNLIKNLDKNSYANFSPEQILSEYNYLGYHVGSRSFYSSTTDQSGWLTSTLIFDNLGFDSSWYELNDEVLTLYDYYYKGLSLKTVELLIPYTKNLSETSYIVRPPENWLELNCSEFHSINLSP